MTVEEVWCIVQETSLQMKETDRRIDKLCEKMSSEIEKVSKQIGGINDNLGRHAEQFFQNVFAENKVFGDIEYDDMILNMMHKEKDGEGVEFDIVLENGNAVALIEVKNRIRSNFVQKLAEERVKKFRKYFPRYKNYDVYLGVAGFSLDKAVLEIAKKYGVGIIKQVGKGIEIKEGRLKKY